MLVLVRAGDTGEWLPLEPVDGLPEGGLRPLCGPDAASMLESETPMPVVAFGPWPHGADSGVDAVCLTPGGGIELVVSTFGESPRDTLWRLVDVAGALRGTPLSDFALHCTELGGEASVGRWLQARVGGDAAQLEARLQEALDAGEFGFVLVTPRGAGDLAQPLAWLQAGHARVRVFELEILRAGAVQAVEGVEVPIDGSDEFDAVEDVEPVELRLVAEPEPMAEEPVAEEPPTAAAEPEPVPEPEPEAPEPVAVAPEPEAPEPVAVEPVAEVIEEEPAIDAQEQVALEPSNVEAFLAGLDTLDHRASNHLRWLHEALLALVDEAEYTTDGELEHVAGWLHGAQRVPLFGLDSHGLLQLVISSLPTHEQAEFADEVAGLLPNADGATFVEAGFAELDVPAHADDQTLLEYLVDNLVEALPGGRATFGTDPSTAAGPAEVQAATDEPEEPAGEDFFAGISTQHDPDEVNDALQRRAEEEHPTPAASEPEPEPEPKLEERGSRWLRRRGAA